MTRTSDTRITGYDPLLSPSALLDQLPLGDEAAAIVEQSRAGVRAVLDGSDDRLLVIAGPCSVHDPAAALDYAGQLIGARELHRADLLIVMRVYFEKPRTTVGWKGLINDPDLDGSFQIDKGLRIARSLLRDINALGVPAGCEFLDMITPQYIADLVAWGAIGARTTESQVHRELASGLSCPVGFKNGTDGNVKIAVDAVHAASQPHHFMAVTKDGQAAVATTSGNGDCHVILRGGKVPNYDAASVGAACAAIDKAGLAGQVMIDVSHANSGKKPENQPLVAEDIAARIAAGEQRILGVMVESHLLGGRQELQPGQPLRYGQSITDGCIDWDTSVQVLQRLAQAVRQRRRVEAGAVLPSAAEIAA